MGGQANLCSLPKVGCKPGHDKQYPDGALRGPIAGAMIPSIRKYADRHAGEVAPIIQGIQRAGADTLRKVADALVRRSILTARGKKQWCAIPVKNALARAH
jgi:hypothetical protein